MNPWLTIFVILLSGLLSGTHAQVSSKKQTLAPRFAVDDGLSQGFIKEFCQDSIGYIWFTTADGLNRYDGIEFKIYRGAVSNNGQISVANCSNIVAADNGDLWLRTEENQVIYYKRKKDAFFHTSFDLPKNVSILEIHPFSGGLLIKTSLNQLFSVGSNSQRDKIIKIDLPFPSEQTYATAITKNGALHLLTGSELYIRHKAEEWQKSRTPFHIKISENNTTPQIIAVDNHIYLSSGKALFRYHNSEFTAIVSAEFNKNRPVLKSGVKDIFGNDWLVLNRVLHKIETGIIAANDTIWPQVYDQYGYVSDVFEDHSGLIWIGRNGLGISTIGVTQQMIKTHASGKIVYTFLLDSLNQIVFPKDILKNFEDGEFLSRIPIIKDQNNALWSYEIRLKDQVQRIYLLKLNWAGKVIKEFLVPNVISGHPQRTNYLLHADNSSGIYLFSNNEVCRLNLETSKILSHSFLRESAKKVAPEISCVVALPSDRFLVGTAWGLLEDDWTMRQFKFIDNELKGKSILCMAEGEDHLVWIGTKGHGIYLYDAKNEQIIDHFTTQNGLPNNVIYGLQIDQKGHVWFSSNKGISRLSPPTKSVDVYTKADGLQGNEFNTFSYARGQNGELFFGGMNGVNSFFPSQIQAHDYTPISAIESIVINGERQMNGPFRDRISLKHNENMLTINLRALDYNNPSKNKFQIKLLGLHDKWMSPDQNASATFANLAPGEYTLLVKTSNNKGVWSKTHKVIIEINGPWWHSWWAYLAYLLIPLIIIFLFLNLRLKRVRLSAKLANEEKEAKKLKELDQMKSDFVSNIIHEFRTPLTLMLGPIENVHSKVGPSEQKELELAKTNGHRIIDLMNQLLDISKLENHSMKVNLQKGQLNQTISSIVEDFKAHSNQKKISLEYTSSISNLESEFDDQKIEMVILNLLSNAFKFTPENGQIIISLKSITDSYIIEVIDTGIGIPKNETSNIFDRFYQVDSSNTRQKGGTGIGLALCKEIMTLLDGDIEAVSQEKGACFRVHLPIINPVNLTKADLKQVARKPKVDSPQITEADHEANDGKKILIVEDNDELRQHLINILRDTYSIYEAENGKTGVEMALKIIPDLIITDVMMPELDGIDLCQAIKTNELTCHVPIIMLTAKSSLEHKIKGIEVGADAYISKPFSQQELKTRIQQLLELRASLMSFYLSRSDQQEALQPAAEIDLNNSFLSRINELIESNISNSNLNSELLVDAAGMSKSQIYRKLKAITGKSINHYIRWYRLQKAYELLLSKDHSLKEITYLTGFNSQSYFSRSFKEEFGIAPSEL